LITRVIENGRVVDRYETPFGIRTVRFDPNTGFWLNGRNIKLKGTNNHQDHAGLGVALPDAVQIYRLKQLKAMGGNAYRASHNPPTPELLDAADRLGMLVIDEHRMQGASPAIADQLSRLVERDRNHPSVVLWSVGNEEWAIEGNEMGARLTKLMQEQVHRLDPTRRTTVAISGGAQKGSSTTTDTLGFNYRSQHDVDAYHRAFPDTPTMMSEEGSTVTTRGIYETDRAAVHIAAYDLPQRPTGTSSIEQGWKAVVERPWMAGMFVWTGFDYRGETTPFGWPAISSQFGMLDTTGAFKDTAWYLKSWWTEEPVVHLLPHWNRPQSSGPVPVWVYSNAELVELSLNGRSLGRQAMPANGHLEWSVPWQSGALVATGWRGGRQIGRDFVATTGTAVRATLAADRSRIAADGQDVAMISVGASDAKRRGVPTADNGMNFTISGPGRIIGVGNGDPGSHEDDTFVDRYRILPTTGWRLADLANDERFVGLPTVAETGWRDPFRWFPPGEGPKPPRRFILEGTFAMPAETSAVTTLFLPDIAATVRIFVDGVERTERLTRSADGVSLALAPTPGEHRIDMLVTEDASAALRRVQDLGSSNIASLQVRTPAAPWRRRLFNGHAQVIVQSTGGPGRILVEARSPDLQSAVVAIQAGS
jgi:beta-galactosidase